MKRLLPVLLVVLVLLVASCQGSEDSSPWTRVFTDEADFVYFGTLTTTSDGGFLIVMQTNYDDGNSLRQMRLLKTDRNGYEIWNKSIDEYRGARNVLSTFETSDEGFIILAISREEEQDNLVIVKVDKRGNHLWKEIVGPNGDMHPFPAVTRTPDDSVIISWVSTTENSIKVIEIDTRGNVLLNSTLNVSIDDPACIDYVIENMSDGGFVIACTKYDAEDKGDIYIVRLDGEGRELWSRLCGDEATAESPMYVRETADGGIVIIGAVSPYIETGIDDVIYFRVDVNIGIVRLDDEGILLSEKTHGSVDWLERVHSVVEMADGGFIFAGERGTYMPGSQMAYLLKVNRWGNEVWSRTLGSNEVRNCSEACSILPATDGWFAVAGWAASEFYGIDTDIFLMKIDSEGNFNPPP